MKPSVTAGQHILEIEWWATDDVMIRARTLAIESIPPHLGRVAYATEALQKTTNTWEDIPGMSTTVTTEAMQDFAITFSADSVADSGRLLVRALVDGSKVSDVAFVEAGSGARFGARSYTFVRKNLPAGAHDVRIQWRVENGKARLGPRTLAVSAGRPTGAAGMDAVSLSLPESKYTSTQYVTVASEAFTTQGPNSSAILSFGAEIKATGKAYVRALVDGVMTSDAPVQLAHGGSSFRVASYQFRATNLAPGYHTVEFQIAVESGKSATLRNRFHRVLYRPRSGAELVRAWDTPWNGGMKPRHMSRPLLVICFDPVRPDHPRPSKQRLREIIEGVDGGISFKGWVANNSKGRLSFSEVRYVGCEDGNWLLAPPAHRDDYYWKYNAWPEMRKDALKAADPQVDFHSYDTDGDGVVSPDELGVLLVRPQNTPDGMYREQKANLDGKGDLTVHMLELYISSTGQRRTNAGVIAHEASHALIGAPDIYGCDQSIVAPKYYSVMYWHFDANSMDPFFKMKAGWAIPSLVDIGSSVDKTVQIPDVSAAGEVVVLHNRARGDGEYFILENRAPGNIYDSTLDAGVQVWQVLESDALVSMYPPPNGASCDPGAKRLRRVGILRNMNQSIMLQYADGTSTGVTLTSLGAPGSTQGIRIYRQ